MATKAPMEEILNLIDSLIDGIEEKQDTADKNNAENMADCDSTLLSLNS
jgi:hypothetical protein